jgi:hypothetical protein
MNGKKEQFDNNINLQVSNEFKTDLVNLFKPGRSVPPEIDRAILDKASNKFLHRQKRNRIVRRIGIAAATAAVILLAFSLDLSKRSKTQVPTASLAQTVSFDIDKSGRVDILDAFKLARHIESAATVDTNLDMNGDGIINQDDVDSIATAAVSLNKGVL